MIDTQELRKNERLASHISKLIDACEKYSDEQKGDRDKALEYYDGKVTDLTVDKGHSQAVSMDVRAVIKKMMPSIMRTLLSNDKIVEFGPVGPDDEDQAEQATDFMNHVVVPETDAERAVQDAIFDTLTVKTGILKWIAYKRSKARIHEYTNQSEETLIGLDGEPGIEVFDYVEKPETDQSILQLDPDAKRCDYKIRQIEEKVDVKLQAIPRGSFLILPGYSIEESPIVGDREAVTRSELISRGYDPKIVKDLSSEDSNDEDRDDSRARQGDDWSEIQVKLSEAMEQILVYQVYVRLDLDEDGIAEIYKVCMAERGEDDRTKEPRYGILDIEPVDEAPYAEVVAEHEAHEFEGHSTAEDVMPIQRIKTALVREGLDNIYWRNKPQPYVKPKKLTKKGIDAVYNPQFGKPIELADNATPEEAVSWREVPFMADKAFEVMEYLDQEIEDRTGVNDQSSSLDPEAFANMAATSANIWSESSVAQIAMTIRTLARGGIKKAFRGLLRLVIAHADRPRTLRLRKTWVQYDPRHWNVDMDCTVNIGLGAGSRERDLNVLQLIYNIQKELLLNIGADNPIVKSDQLYNTLEKIVETAGFPSADPYFTSPDPNEVDRLLSKGQGPSEAETKAQTQMQIEQVKADAQKQIEAAQLEADIMVRDAETKAKKEIEILKADLHHELTVFKEEIGFQKHRENLQLEREKIGLTPPALESFKPGDLIDAG